ncbi:hypothetical protein DCC62_29220 [candidate division KSB1 bacterium]|nr:MAG: hypothetical protein DCC62_29220 [candidate division KSB1 bacterium]
MIAFILIRPMENNVFVSGWNDLTYEQIKENQVEMSMRDFDTQEVIWKIHQTPKSPSVWIGEVLTAIDAVTQNTGLSSRRATIEKILQRWYEVVWLQRRWDRETEDYYKSLTPEEIAEDRDWTHAVSQQAQRWDD